jgi:hypothetical protein
MKFPRSFSRTYKVVTTLNNRSRNVSDFPNVIQDLPVAGEKPTVYKIVSETQKRVNLKRQVFSELKTQVTQVTHQIIRDNRISSPAANNDLSENETEKENMRKSLLFPSRVSQTLFTTSFQHKRTVIQCFKVKMMTTIFCYY